MRRMGRPQNTKPEQFFRLVQKTETCWLWLGCANKDGYGEAHWFGHKRLAHQVAYEIATGKPWPAPLISRHTCHVRLCVNPGHIIPGTRPENMRDMVEAGRACCGARRANSKLSATERLEARELRRQGWTLRAIGERFGVNESRAFRVIAAVEKNGE
jgi:hypothetical protein